LDGTGEKKGVARRASKSAAGRTSRIVSSCFLVAANPEIELAWPA
jgi:hypothetical protein